MLRAYLALAIIAPLVSCGPSPNAPGVGGVTRAQADALNQAATELDERANAGQEAISQR